MDIGDIRDEYVTKGLHRKDLQEDPFLQFEQWFLEAQKAELFELNAMSLATSSARGDTSIRTVLLKFFDNRGFVFYTNYESTKAKQISENDQVALLFPWLQLHRQVVIRGRAEKISKSESLKYFLSRPKGSQIGAWISSQSSVITTRSLLESKFNEFKQKFMNKEIPLPSFWGGYRVVPTSIEFWQGQVNRLHDRFLYNQQEDGEWKVERLAP
jgi:pyridoxamine 5'-phosphate oxidase